MLAPLVRDVLRAFDRDINLVMARGVQVLFGVAVSEYQRALESRALLDFSEVLRRAVDLLRQMDEFSQSRYRLESRSTITCWSTSSRTRAGCNGS